MDIYQVSLEGFENGTHVQFNLYDCANYETAMKEVKTHKHVKAPEGNQYLALLFYDKEQAIKDGILEEKIEDVWDDGRLFRFKIE
ncbi:hypothetical protein GOV10_06975 [Candidatus Woesearchaeota archaeon]|nr:hypothetical protein [Candidatus Woesearchaeota archaeon]